MLFSGNLNKKQTNKAPLTGANPTLKSDFSPFSQLGFAADMADILEKFNQANSLAGDCAVAITTVQPSVHELTYEERLNTDKEFYAQECKRLFGKRRKTPKNRIQQALSTLSQIQIVPDEMGKLIRIDPEMGRLSIVFNEAYLLRVWSIAHDINRNGAGDGKIAKSALLEALRWEYGIPFTNKRFEQWMKAGHEVYWDDTGDTLYISGRATLARIYTERAIETRPEAILSNRPGVRDMLLMSGDSLARFEARLYGAWHSYRNNPKIARATLSMLFNRHKVTFRRWEGQLQRGDFEIVANYHHTVEPDLAPVGAEISLTRGGRVLYVKQGPNSYQSKTRQHAHRGSSSKVRKISNAVLRIHNMGGCVLKQYFDSEDKAKQYAKKHDSSVVVFRGFNRYGHGIWELTPDGICETNEFSRVHFRRENQFRATQFNDYWGYIHGQREVFMDD